MHEPSTQQPPGDRSGISTFRLYAYGISLGLSLLLRAQIGAALPYLIRPVNYWRTVEYQFITREAGFCRQDRILDIGSPKLLSLYLAEKVGTEVFATDIEDYFVPRLRQIRQIRRIPPERLHLDVEDGRRLSYSDNTFTKVYSISVLEHIPDDGDSECLREDPARPGGRRALPPHRAVLSHLPSGISEGRLLLGRLL